MPAVHGPCGVPIKRSDGLDRCPDRSLLYNTACDDGSCMNHIIGADLVTPKQSSECEARR
eukprot:3122510-Prymnesium_polylepis.1